MPHPTPQTMAQTKHEMIEATRTYASLIWPTQHLSGSRFIAPPSLPPIRAKLAGYEINPSTGNAMHLPDKPTIAQFQNLANYYATTLEQARTYYIGEELSNLALRTEMPQYRLTADMLPSPVGFLVWATPIGDAEKVVSKHSWVDRYGVVTEDTSDPGEAPWSPFKDARSPVVGVSWRYEPDYDCVWIVFYTANDEIVQIIGDDVGAEHLARARQMTGPLSFEREQMLPLDRPLNWFDADPADGPRMAVTAAAEENTEIGRKVNEEIRPQLTAMVRTLVSTWMLMKWKIAHREEIPPPPYVVKQVARDTGRSRAEVREDNATVIVRLGQPLQHRKPREGSEAGKWKVRVVVGPHIRTRQYIPATGEFDFTPRLIAPYVAGPAGAPIRNVDKVFLLD